MLRWIEGDLEKRVLVRIYNNQSRNYLQTQDWDWGPKNYNNMLVNTISRRREYDFQKKEGGDGIVAFRKMCMTASFHGS